MLAIFAIFGPTVLNMLHVTLPAFRVAGGLLLFLQALTLTFSSPGLSSISEGERSQAQEPGDIAVFPLAFPLIAGPASLTAVVLLMGRTAGQPLEIAVVLACILACLGLTYACLLSTEILQRVLRTTASNVVARLSGMILAALAVQFIFDGLRGAHLFS